MDIKKLLREALLSEGYAEQRELVQYARMMLEKTCVSLMNNYYNQGRLVECGVTNTSIRAYTSKFENIQKFATQRKLIVIITPEAIDGDERKVGKHFEQLQGEKHMQSVIILRLFKEDVEAIEAIFEKYDEAADKPVTDYILKLHHTTVIHELQHDYDSFRSDGKFNNIKGYSEFKELDARSGELFNRGLKNLSPEEKEEYYKGLNAYVNLPHELNARFAQALQDVNIEDTTKDWQTIYNEFIQKIFEWKRVEEPNKKKLIKRLFKIFQEVR